MLFNDCNNNNPVKILKNFTKFQVEMASRHPVSAVITAKEKRYLPVKHYVFIVEVRWSDGSKIPIYRQYSDFAELHTSLCDVVAAMTNVKTQLPMFPSKKVFQRSEIQRVATVRRHAFDDYCQALLKLDSLISHDKVVIDFFKARHDDINPPESDKQSPEKSPSSLFAALAPFLPGKHKSDDDKNIRHSKSANNLEILDVDDPIYVSSPIICQTYIALADYTPEEKGEMKLKESMSVEVVEKYDNGWWFVQTEYGFGWAPATYLTPIGCTDEEEEPEPIYSGHKYMTTDSYKAEQDDEITFQTGVLVKVLHKLLDGWWIIEYQAKVGYVPATYLVPFNNPHYRDSRYGNRKSRKPTKRRKTITNSKGRSLNVKKHRDLSIYKKMSTKLSKEDAVVIAGKLATELAQDSSPLTVQLPVKRGNTAKKSVRMMEPGSHVNAMKAKCDYEYIDEDEMEDINAWVDKNIRTSLEHPPALPVRSPDKLSPPLVPENGSAGSGLVHIKPATGSRLSFVKPPSSAAKTERHSLPNIFQKAPAAPVPKRTSDGSNFSSLEEDPIYNTAAPGMVYAKPPTLKKTPVLPSQFVNYEDDDDVILSTSENTRSDDTGSSSDKLPLRMNNNQERNDKTPVLYSKVNKDKTSSDQRQEEQVCAVYNNIPQIKLTTNVSGNKQPKQQQTVEKQSTSSLNFASNDIRTKPYNTTKPDGKGDLISKSFEKIFNDINKRGASREATDFLVGHIQSRTISSVRSNDSGELILTFAKENREEFI